MLTPGSTLGGRYQLTERIASGGMGDVWKAEDAVLGRTVAVKVLLPTLLAEPGFATRFHGEARIMATINHPGVVDVYDFGESDLAGGGRVTYLVMEYVRGEPLNEVLETAGRLTAQRALNLVAQAAEALQAAHDKGIIHRDVKPGNLLVRPDGTLVLTDFGIARSGVTANLTAVGSTLGTAAYMSPEQASGEQAGPLSDVYSLGVVAYQCVSGHRPFEGSNPLAVAVMHIRENPPPLPGDIPPGVRGFIERAMAKNVAARWPSAMAMAQAARDALGGGSTGGFPSRGAVPTPGLPHVVPGQQTVPLRPATPDAPAYGAGTASVYGTSGLPTHGMGGLPTHGAGSASVYGTGDLSAYGTGKPNKGKGLLVVGVASAVLVLLTLGGLGYAIAVDRKRENTGQSVLEAQTTTPEAVVTPAAPTMITIDCAGMVGKPFKNVEDKLRKLELNIQMVPVASDEDEGRVVDIPCEASTGSTVSVEVSKGKPTPPPHTKQPWPTWSNSPSPSATPTSPKPTDRTNHDPQETTP